MIPALVLAGGKSSRLGAEKAMALFKGEPLLAHAVTRLQAQGFAAAINAPPTSAAAEWATTRGLILLSDDPADPIGPLAGVRAGLSFAQSKGANILATGACDTPALPAALERELISSLGAGSAAATARSPSGLQSLCTAWRVAPTLAALNAHFAAGRHPAVHDLLNELGAVEVFFPDDAAFANLNTWDDFAQAEATRP